MVTHGARRLLWLACLALLLVGPGCRYPRDVEGTLDRVRGGVLHVGVTENPPWVVRGDPPAGVEVDLAREIAAALDARVRWHWGAQSELIAALEQRQIDLVIGGLRDNPALTKQVALTKPYAKLPAGVGFPAGAGKAPPDNLDGQTVHVPRVNHLADPLHDEGARVVPFDGPPPTGQALGGAHWWLRARGLTVGPWVLRTERHVMAVPKGENAWLALVQRHLNGVDDLPARLADASRAYPDGQGGESQ
ncbi:substrate-binding periplasmic protein [Alloalcanivorax marinus]|uniref:substrate-binding periplasmic protein n=1 Tax=Alloalcanivorax marinus TaxID=1177169 RepID=UPI00195BD154|nr:transporter substrate-binding domain-containing protein [Alloalcanivorax marinus]MBM7333619.1 transporter substrate-binding domain-containing protein [Alloalcanivorax marinus]